MHREHVGLGAIVLTNGSPLVGVTLLDWTLLTVVLVYWIELGVVLGYALLRGLFAQHPPQRSDGPGIVGALTRKRGGVALPWRDLRVEVANLPVVAVAGVLFGVGWLVSGLIALGGTAHASESAIGVHGVVATLVALVGVTIGRGVETVTDYFIEGRYRELNVQLALRSGSVPLFVVGAVLAGGGLLAASGAPGEILLVGLVATKTSLDLGAHYGGPPPSVDEGRLPAGWLEEPRQWLDVDESTPQRIVRPHRGAVVLEGVLRGFQSGFGQFGLVAVGVGIAFAIAIDSYTPLPIFSGFGAVVIALACVVTAVDRAIRFGWMEYRVGRHLVGYDRLLGEPQWQVPGWKIERADARQTRVDRRFGTETLVVEHEGWKIRLPHVPDARALEPADRDGHRPHGREPTPSDADCESERDRLGGVSTTAMDDYEGFDGRSRP